MEYIERHEGTIDYIVGMQPTSPIRNSSDLSEAIEECIRNNYDSMLSVCELEDYFIWEIKEGIPKPVNYNKDNRKMRQNIDTTYLENGSFYIFKPEILKNTNNRLGGSIGIYLMEKHKMFQIDNFEDIKICESIMRGYGLNIC